MNYQVLSIVIGLIFIYLLYSLLASIIQEIMAVWFGYRAKILRIAIERMLGSGDRDRGMLKTMGYLLNRNFIIWVFNLIPKSEGNEKTISFIDSFYNHPLIKFLGEGSSRSEPAYLKKDSFSKVMIDLLRGEDYQPGESQRDAIQKSLTDAKITCDNRATKINNASKTILEIGEKRHEFLGATLLILKKNEVDELKEGITEIQNEKKTQESVLFIDPETLKYLKSIWADSQGDVEKFKLLLEDWFEKTMLRATDWYKKYTQVFLFLIGMAIAISFNVDTIKIIKKLEKDPDLTDKVVTQAENFLAAYPELGDNSLNQATRRSPKTDSILNTRRDILINQANHLIQGDIKRANDLLGLGWKDFKLDNTPIGISFFLRMVVGWLLTALAISLGAPFWFDLLNKLMRLRTSYSSDEKGGNNKETINSNGINHIPTIKRKG